ncbi:hypothetical protein BMETH_2205_0 [methanotrophic bacterial endosymbiont of Bathymodiolus sp.]|nr:hypothetical protein BMETH_2205_0 [methanotrophic bacterial endosymbiont of Bathymodiolus sp.]
MGYCLDRRGFSEQYRPHEQQQLRRYLLCRFPADRLAPAQY